VNLSSAGGVVEAYNVRAASAEDTFEVGTVSGDIQLETISSPRVLAKTVSGTLTMSGALVKSGYYSFTNVTGEIVLAMPANASFRLSAKVSDKQNIDSEFPLKYASETSPTPPARPRVLPLPPDNEKPLKEKEKSVAKPAPPAKTPAPLRTGPAVGPMTERPMVIVPYVRRIEAICGSGDAVISIASFGGAIRLKKL
jgi:hypothetical protein